MDLRENPFYLLGATPRDDKSRLMDLSDEKSLIDESGIINDARTMLSNPGKRILCEISWLPGISPKQVNSIVELINNEPKQVFQNLQENVLPPLVATNALASAISNLPEQTNGKDLSEWIISLAKYHEEINSEDLVIVLNEEREISKFSSINDISRVEDALSDQRDYYKQVIKSALNKLPPFEIVTAVTKSVEETTSLGVHQGPIIIDDMVDSFEVESQQFLAEETKNVDVIIKRILDSVKIEKHRDTVIPELVTRLEEVIRNWDFVAQPMQVSCRSKGVRHDLSHELSRKLRDLTLDLFEKYDMLDLSKRITVLQKEVFAEVDQVLEQSKVDEDALNNIAYERETAVDDIQKWKNEITYEADIGIALFKKKLRVSPDGVSFKGKLFPLDEIVAVRWGGTQKQHSTECTITVRTRSDSIFIQTNNERIYSRFTEKLWKAVGVRLLTDFLQLIDSGECYPFGSSNVCNEGVELVRKKLFGEEKKFFSWSQLSTNIHSGYFSIQSINNPDFNVHLLYETDDNVHILSTAINILKDKSASSFSELL